MEAGRTLFVQVIDGDVCRQGLLDESRLRDLRPQSPPGAHLAERHGLAGRLLKGHKRLLRLLVRSVYLFPVLLVPKCIMSWRRQSQGDWITVAFVALVLIFFVAVAIYLVLFLAAGLPSKRRHGWRLRAGAIGEQGCDPPMPATALQELLHSAPEEGLAGPLRARGRARAFNAQAGGPLLRDLWVEAGDVVVRATSSRPFLVENEGQPPVLVPAGVPLVLSAYQPAHLVADEESLAVQTVQGALRLAPPAGACMQLSLDEGAWLEVHAPHHRRLRSLDEAIIDGLSYTPEPGEAAASPYRDGAARAALLALPGDDDPVRLRLVEPHR